MSVPNSFASVTAATGAQLDANFAAVLNLAGGGEVTGTGSGSGLVILSDTGNASGVSFKLIGNGSTTPSKTIQVAAGLLKILNDAQSASIAQLTDAGVFTLGANGASGLDAVAYQQVKNAVPVGAYATTSGTTIAATTGTFTAPSAGVLICQGAYSSSTDSSTSFTLSTSLGGFVGLTEVFYATFGTDFGYLPMTTGQTTTATITLTSSVSQTANVSVSCFFLPMA
jgi:hypothetical protein